MAADLLVVSYLTVVVVAALRAWRRYGTLDLRWLGPARPSWLVFRRVSQCLASALTAGAWWTIAAIAVLTTVAAYTRFEFSLPGWVLLALAGMSTEFLVVWLNGGWVTGGPAGECRRSGAAPLPALEAGPPSDCPVVCYSARPGLGFLARLVALAGLGACIALIPRCPIFAGWRVPPMFWWWIAGVFALASVWPLASTVTRARVDSGQLQGSTVWRTRRFAYALRELRVACVRSGRDNELLIVTRLGGPPIVFSSRGAGYGQVVHCIVQCLTQPADAG